MSYDVDVECPSCGLMFEQLEWVNGECPRCGRGFWWEEDCTEDYSDCWSYVEWEELKIGGSDGRHGFVPEEGV